MSRDFKPTHDVDELIAETERQSDRYTATFLSYTEMIWDPATGEMISDTTTIHDTLTNPEENTE